MGAPGSRSAACSGPSATPRRTATRWVRPWPATVSSMGVDPPLAVLSERPQLLPAFFKQHFAQVTNPAIDPQREGLVMSLRTSVGSPGNLLDDSPAHAPRVPRAR